MPRLLPTRSLGGRRATGALAVGLALAALSAGVAGCGKDEFEDRTAKVEASDRTTTFDVDSCGLDQQTAFVVGRTTGGSVLQAAVGVRADHTTGVPRSTGLTVTDDGVELAAFGAESWERRGMTGPAPGTITSARIRGSRIQVSGAFVQVRDDGTPDPASAAPPIPFTLDARCDQAEDT